MFVLFSGWNESHSILNRLFVSLAVKHLSLYNTATYVLCCITNSFTAFSDTKGIDFRPNSNVPEEWLILVHWPMLYVSLSDALLYQVCYLILKRAEDGGWVSEACPLTYRADLWELVALRLVYFEFCMALFQVLSCMSCRHNQVYECSNRVGYI